MNFADRMRRMELFKGAPCIDSDVDMVPSSAVEADAAIAVCGTCTLIDECRDDFRARWAESKSTSFGVYGGIHVPGPNDGGAASSRRRAALKTLGVRS